MFKTFVAFDENNQELLNCDHRIIAIYAKNGQEAFDYMPHREYRRCSYLKVCEHDETGNKIYKKSKYFKEKYL